MSNKVSIKMLFLSFFVILSILFLGFNVKNKNMSKPVYNVYLDGKIIGVINSKKEFEKYINLQEEQLKKRYGVSKVYAPNGVEIRKNNTFNSKVISNQEIYNKLIQMKNFTIKGLIVTISNKESDSKDESEKQEDIVIKVLNKKIFDDALTNTIKAFVDEEDYQNYMNSTQKEIKETGSIIENIDIEQDISYKDAYISTNEKIYINSDELSKFLLFGTTKNQDKYIVQTGDTIEKVADENKLNVREFLIANPSFTSKDNLLYESQEVVVGLINPVVDVIVEEHSVTEEAKEFETEIQYDDEQYIGYESVSREGEDGLYRITKKHQYINGLLVDTTNINSTELKPSINEVLIKGGKYAPNIADLSYWAWPTNKPYTITSGFEWRWGYFHGAIDIAGTGYGSPVYAGNNGVVTRAGSNCTPGYTSCNHGMGNYVMINHNIGGYETVYMHLKSVNVNVGQTVARGQKIGTMGNTGNVYPIPSSYNPYGGTHLHYEIKINGTKINPLNMY